LDNGVDERDLREAVFLKVVGNPNIWWQVTIV
jgi:hypothetical protein